MAGARARADRESVDRVFKARSTGKTETVTLSYFRHGSILEGGTLVGNGLTGGFAIQQFRADDLSFAQYSHLPGTRGRVQAFPAAVRGNKFPAYEEELLTRCVNLDEAYRAFARKTADRKWKELGYVIELGREIEVKRNGLLVAKIRFENRKECLKIDKFYMGNLKQTLEYKLLVDYVGKRFKDVVDRGTLVADYRLHPTFSSQYKWDGDLKSVEDLGLLNNSRGDRTSLAPAFIVSIALVLLGAFIVAVISWRRRRFRV
jgi:hypothetical protein